jgi:uncharacterized membrane protein YbhN (UPF0104 family)
MKNRRALQPVIFLAGLAGLALAVVTTVGDAQGTVLPSPPALVIGGALCLVAICASARTWGALFGDTLRDRRSRAVMRGTFYLSQLTKYLPVGGVAQAASQLSLAPSAGITVRKAAVAFPVSAVCAVAAGATLGSGLAVAGDLPGWARVVAALGLASPLLLYRPWMAKTLGLARRFVHRLPDIDHLPSQREIVASYLWAALTIGSFSVAYAVLLASTTDGENPARVFCAYALAWVIGFLAVPIPAGLGVREALLVAFLPGVGTAALIAASLAIRILGIATEALALTGNRALLRHHARPVEVADQLTPP